MELTDQQVREWLTNIHRPSVLGDPDVVRNVLRDHGWTTVGETSFELAEDVRRFLRARIEKLQPDQGAPERAWRPYRVLVLTFLEAHSQRTVARLMGLSPRQISRECTQAIQLLRSLIQNP